MDSKCAFFIGHRDAPESIKPQLSVAIEKCITEYDITWFVVGQYGNFDRLAAKAVIDAKSRHNGISLSLLLPYHPAERPVALSAGFDGTFYPEGMESVPRRFAIVRANHYMLGHCDCLITYAWHPASNAHDLLESAMRLGIKVLRIAKED